MYDLAAQGLHRLYAISRHGSAHEWNDTLLYEWISDSVKATDFLVVVGQEREVNIKDTDYDIAAVEQGTAEILINVRRNRNEVTCKEMGSGNSDVAWVYYKCMSEYFQSADINSKPTNLDTNSRSTNLDTNSKAANANPHTQITHN